MLGKLIGSINKERALVYLVAREAGYAREIARFFDVPLNPIQKALDGLERAGVLVSRVIGSTREYRLNPATACGMSSEHWSKRHSRCIPNDCARSF